MQLLDKGSAAPSVVRRGAGVRVTVTFVILLVLAVGGVLGVVAVGSVLIPPSGVWAVLTGGTVENPVWGPIVTELRIPRAATAALVGGSLGVAGLQMQTLFRNGLADPYILGVSSGASLGVAFVILSAGISSSAGLLAGTGLGRNLAIILAASVGAMVVLSVMLVVATWFRNVATVLIVGVAVGAFSYAIVSILIYFSTPESVQSFSIWTFGSFQGVTPSQLLPFAAFVALGLGIGAAGVKSLNAMLLGDQYAASLGVSVFWLRLITMISASLIAGVVTAFCGPIGFIGLAVPHLARGLLRTADQRVLFPACILVGIILASFCGILAQVPGQDATLPINAATALFGAPVVLWVLLRSAREGGTAEL